MPEPNRRPSYVYQVDLERGTLNRSPVSSTELPQGNDPRRPSIGFQDTDGAHYAAAPDGNKGWKVYVYNGVQWAKENRPKVTTAVKASADALILGGTAVKTYGGPAYATTATALQAAGTVLKTGAQIADASQYAQSAVQTYRQEGGMSKQTLYEGSKAVAQAGAFVAQAANGFGPLTQGAQGGLGMTNQVASFAGYYATGSTQQEDRKNKAVAEQQFERMRDGGRGAPVNPAVTFDTGVFDSGRQRPGITRQETTQWDPRAPEIPGGDLGSSSAARMYTPTSATSTSVAQTGGATRRATVAQDPIVAQGVTLSQAREYAKQSDGWKAAVERYEASSGAAQASKTRSQRTPSPPRKGKG
jgi:hypothetical protein